MNSLVKDREGILEIKDCIAVVTGGASGLGEATVRNLAGGGARVAILDMQADKGEALATELGDNVIFANTDITNEESVKVAINKAVDAFGGINVVINCAGIGHSRKILGKQGPTPLDHFNKLIQVNLMGAINVIRLSLEQMVKRPMLNEDGERGVIINTSSGAAFEGQVGQTAYSASKGGIVSMTLPMARECSRYGIRVLAIAPGMFETPMLASEMSEEARDSLRKMVPFPHRLGKPSEYARLVQHILENIMLNGAVIRLDGGLRMQAY